MTEPTRDSTEETAHGETGRRLRAAREKAGLELQTLADQLHLRPAIVRAIEEGDYGSVPSELFLKGYVRSYARHVGVSDDEMIERLSRELAPEKESEEEHERTSGHLPALESRKRKQKMSLAGVALVVLVLVLLPFIWPQSDGPDTGEAQPSGSEEQRQPSDTETGADIGTDGFENSSGARNNEVSPALNEVETLDAPSSEPAPVEEDGSDASTGSNGNTAGQPSSSEPLEPVEPQPPRVESLTDSNESAPDGRDAQQQVRLEIRFRDDCWVEVVNGEGTRVVARLATAGDQVRYSGPGPLSVLLGAVGAVERAEFMGQTLDMDGYPARAGRVRFQLAQNDFDSDQD